jgi:hypothetical protein
MAHGALLLGSAFLLLGADSPGSADGISFNQASRLTAEALARRLLGGSGRSMHELGRPHFSNGPFYGPGLRSLTFASRPRSAGYPGLCEADVIAVDLEPERAENIDRDTPSRVKGKRSYRLYKVAGDPNQAAGRLESRCRHAGPVLAGSADAVEFFSVIGDSDGPERAAASLAARAVDLAIRGARAPAGTKIACTEDEALPEEPLCGNPERLLASLSPANLLGVEVEECEDAPKHLCVTADFPRRRPASDEIADQRQITLTLEIDRAAIDPPPSSFGIVSLEIALHTIVS